MTKITFAEKTRSPVSYRLKFWPRGKWAEDRTEYFPTFEAAKDRANRLNRTVNIDYIITQEVEMASKGFEDAP